MASYSTFECYVRSADAAPIPAANVAVKVFDFTNNVALPDLASDANGVVAGGTLPLPAGTKVRFKFELPDLRCGYREESLY